MSISRNQIIEFLEDQTIDKDKLLFELIKDNESVSEKLKITKIEEEPEYNQEYKCCSSCRYDGGGKCKSSKFANDWKKALMSA